MKTAILGRQNPRSLREIMRDRIVAAGFEAELRDMETRTLLDFADIISEYDAVIPCGEKIPASAMRTLAAGKTRLISRWGVGTDEMDHAAATECGIAICNAAGCFSTAVAECALALMINLLRQFPARDASVRAGDWSWFFEGRVGRQLEGKTVGLIGFGDIARALAKMLYGFDCRVLAYDIKWDAETAEKYGVVFADIDMIRRQSDIISLHVPALPSTFDMVNREFLLGMKRDAILINTGRGKLVDEDALAWALQNGVIAGAGLDVYKNEPPLPDNPLLKLGNVMLLPHAGAATYEGNHTGCLIASQNVIDFFSGRQVKNILNPEYIKYVK